MAGRPASWLTGWLAGWLLAFAWLPSRELFPLREDEDKENATKAIQGITRVAHSNILFAIRFSSCTPLAQVRFRTSGAAAAFLLARTHSSAGLVDTATTLTNQARGSRSQEPRSWIPPTHRVRESPSLSKGPGTKKSRTETENIKRVCR